MAGIFPANCALVIAVATLFWNFYRQSRPVARLRVEVDAGMADDPSPEKVRFKLCNNGAVPLTVSGLALTVYPYKVLRILGIAQEWHNLVNREQPHIRLPKFLAVGEVWSGTAILETPLVDALDAGWLCYKVYASHRSSPLVGSVRRQNLLYLLRA